MNLFTYNYSTNRYILPPVYPSLYAKYIMMSKLGTVHTLLHNLGRELDNKQVKKKKSKKAPIYFSQVLYPKVLPFYKRSITQKPNLSVQVIYIYWNIKIKALYYLSYT